MAASTCRHGFSSWLGSLLLIIGITVLSGLPAHALPTQLTQTDHSIQAAPSENTAVLDSAPVNETTRTIETGEASDIPAPAQAQSDDAPAPSAEPGAATPAPTQGTPAAAPSPSPAKPASNKPKPIVRAVRKGFWYDLDVRVMPENFDWFASRPPKKGPMYTNNYTFYDLRARPGIGYDEKYFQFRAQLQLSVLDNLPDHATSPSPQGNLGFGGVYHGQAFSSSSASLGIRQMYVHFGEINKSGFQLGRFTLDDQSEAQSTDPTLDFLKKQRISRHLFGSLDYTVFDRSFTGARADVDTGPVLLTAVALQPTQDDVHFGTDDSRLLIYNGAMTFKEVDLIPNGEGQIYVNHYDDTRNVPEVDDRVTKANINLEGGNHITTIGFHYIGKIGEDGDAAVWYGHQTGSWGTLAQNASAFQAELGLQLHQVPWQPWFRIGYSQFSGDANPGDDQHGTFMGATLDPRNKGIGFYTQANINDLIESIILQPRKETQFRFDLHEVSLNNPHDLWYAAAIGTQNQFSNGLVSRPSGGYSQLGTMGEITLSNQFDAHNLLIFHFLQLWGGKVVAFNFNKQTDAHQMYLEYHFLWP